MSSKVQPSPLAAFPLLSEAQRDFDEGRFDAAAGRVIQHLRQHREEPRGLAMLGVIALRTGALVQGEQFLRRAMSKGLVTLEMKLELAAALQKQHRMIEALDAYTDLERITGDTRHTAARALILHQIGRAKEALEAYRELLDRERANPAHWTSYGYALRADGKTEDAVAAFRQAISVDPEFGEAWWALASIKSRILTDEDVGAMEHALTLAVDVANIGPLHFALARALHDRDDFERAFFHYQEGNRLEGQSVPYDPNALSKEVDDFIRTTPARPHQTRATTATASDPIPIFIVSMPRSGTTLLEQILDQHPAIEAVGELPYVRAILRAALEIETRRRPIEVPEFIQQLTADEKHELGAEYLKRAALHRRTSVPYFVDKMPTNWSDVVFIREILPQACIIEIRRNAMDCCFSNFIHQFSRAHAAAFDLENMGRCYADYVRLMDHLNAIAPGSMHSISYEALIENPEAVLRPILESLGLAWDNSLLRFYESKGSVRTPSAEQVRRPLNREGIGTWKPYAEWLGPLRDALGPLAEA